MKQVLMGKDPDLEIIPDDVILAKKTIEERFRLDEPDDQKRLDEYRRIYKQLRDKTIR